MPDVDNAIAAMRQQLSDTKCQYRPAVFGLKGNFYSFNVTEKLDFTFNYPKDLIIMAMEGNGNNLLENELLLMG